MTVRETINSRVRKVLVVVYAGGLLFLVGLVAGRVLRIGDWAFVAGLVGLVVAAVASWFAQARYLRCPSCGGNMAPLAFRSWGLNRKVRFCPYCGVDVDTDPSASPVDSSQDW